MPNSPLQTKMVDRVGFVVTNLSALECYQWIHHNERIDTRLRPTARRACSLCLM